MQYDLIVIGGGAAGFFGAITCAEHCSAKILILEQSQHFLQKVKVSGGGRCNVTHHCFDPKLLSQHYPRGAKSMIGLFSRFQASDTVEWFAEKGVILHTEADGRMFPSSNDSATIVNALTDAAKENNIDLRCSEGIRSIKQDGDTFILQTKQEQTFTSSHVLIATGGTRSKAGAKLAESLGHTLIPPVPSLFTFKITDDRIADIAGIAVEHAQLNILGTKLNITGPVLITHWGLSGPGILKISALGARDLAERDYQFQLCVNWVPNADVAELLNKQRNEAGKKQLSSYSPFAHLPKRLWHKLINASEIPPKTLWSQLSKKQAQQLTEQLTKSLFTVHGKSLNKDEFVTCGGVPLKEINLKTMESKLQDRLSFAGEVLDIDGVTGGFNFQNAWTTGFLAGKNIAYQLKSLEKMKEC